ncbi:1-acyl-sn-glycerol-3-phosphate acyltransferase [Candidatus Aerophobetes bacterium]|uniref:1-acyl-sn-glycerol-3-phosphate acyltransferase n=1 Tax=Aerophobetes bacterium TaxID=2030807 RepID=A0A523QIM4_UNCAE|nr:MAG: 1-acyl-sn-glycerol-3-phosphate acyltransferase [Candidatus Aerophobetes bacterium]
MKETPLWYYFLWGLTLIIFKVSFKIKIRGKENIPSKGPAVVASNHLSYLDPIVLGLITPRRMNFIAKEELFGNSLFRALITQLGAFPLKRERFDRAGYERALAILREGGILILFPEGTRAQHGKPGHLRQGAVRIALRAGVPLVPIVIAGTDSILPRGKRTIRLGKIRVEVGKPLAAVKLDKTQDSRRETDELLGSLKRRMKKLRDELYKE